MSSQQHHIERPIARVKGTLTRDESALSHADDLATMITANISRAGYTRLQTPALDLVELHERKSGAAITTRIVELADTTAQGPVCLRPELTVGVVRALIESDSLMSGPLRVQVRGSVYRRADEPGSGLQQIEQIGVELLGDASVEADAEIIALADEAIHSTGIKNSVIRLGDVGLILEAVTSAGLPAETRRAVIETLADAAAVGHGLEYVENALEHWADWLGDQARTSNGTATTGAAHNQDLHRLFHQLIPHVVGRRSETEILNRMQQKWELAGTLPDSLKKASKLVHEIAGLNGPPSEIFARLAASASGSLIQKSLTRLKQLVSILSTRYGIEENRIQIDLKVARGLGFYSGLVFGIHASDNGATATSTELAGGGRYDGLASVLGLKNGADFGVGFAIGLDRVLGLSRAAKADIQDEIQVIIQTDDSSDKSTDTAAQLMKKLRKSGMKARFATPADLADPQPVGLITVSADGKLRGNSECIEQIQNFESRLEQD